MPGGQSSSKPGAKPSGISDIPANLPYQPLLPAERLDDLKYSLCYIVQGYRPTVSVTIYRSPKDSNIYFNAANADGRRLDIKGTSSEEKLAADLLNEHGRGLATLMKCIKVQQAQYYFGESSGAQVLTDVRLSLHKMVGPGMLRDVFVNALPTQRVIKIENLSDDVLGGIKAGTGSYTGKLIIKPSRFKVVEYNGVLVPSYVAVR